MRVIVVDMGEDLAKVRAYVAENKIETAVVVEPKDTPLATAVYGGQCIPHVTVLDRNRRVAFSAGGKQDAPLFAALEELLKKEPALY